MKEYVKPTFQAVKLTLEERIARCYDQPKPGKAGPNNGDHPGKKEHCPSGS